MANEVAPKTEFKSYMMNQVVQYAKGTGLVLNQAEMNYAQDIIVTTLKKFTEDGTDLNTVNFAGCNFAGQIKRNCRLGLSLNENEIYVDVRNNNKTGKKDINFKMQYQGEKKLLQKFCEKGGGIKSFYEDFVMEGETIKFNRDLKTGNMNIADHDIPDYFNRNCSWANKDKVIGAYAIAYHVDGTQTFVMIDKDRINRAIEASPSSDKGIYKKDFKKMVIKTAIHELYKILKVHNVIPDDLQSDYSELQAASEDVKEEIKQNANKDFLEAEYKEVETPEKSISHQATITKPAFNSDTGEVLEPIPAVSKKEEDDFNWG